MLDKIKKLYRRIKKAIRKSQADSTFIIDSKNFHMKEVKLKNKFIKDVAGGKYDIDTMKLIAKELHKLSRLKYNRIF